MRAMFRRVPRSGRGKRPAALQPEPPRQRLQAGRLLWACEVFVACVLAALVVYLHGVLLRHAGGLWRDEVNTVNIAGLASLADIWRVSEHDSFPLLWFVVLRVWGALGWAATDAGLRTLGFLVGLGLVGALWFRAWRMGQSWPMWGLVLLGFNGEFLRWGDSLRAYGLGVLLLVVTFSCIWQLTQRPKLWSWLVALGAALLSVHCLYHNIFLVAAILAGGMAVAWRRGQGRLVLLLVGMGLIVLASFLPYVFVLRRVEEWNMLAQMHCTLAWLAGRAAEVMNAPGKLALGVWVALAGLAVLAAAAGQWRRLTPGLLPGERDLLLFCGMALVVGVPAYVLFLLYLSYPTQPWYYLAPLGLVAVGAETALNVMTRSVGRRIVRLGLVVGLAAVTFSPVLRGARQRQTNVDLIAGQLGRQAASNDFILVTAWEFGVSFERYYRGRTEWSTLPALGFHRYHRYDLLKQKMMSADPIADLLSKVSRTLKSEHRVWVVGRLPAVAPDEPPFLLKPAPLPEVGWNQGIYIYSWGQQISRVLLRQARFFEEIPVEHQVNAYENADLAWFGAGAAAGRSHGSGGSVEDLVGAGGASLIMARRLGARAEGGVGD